jgi:ferredoxin
MKVTVDVDVCIASGACVLACPDVFQQDDDGLVVLVQDEPGSELHDAVHDAMAACPAAVITVEG